MNPIARNLESSYLIAAFLSGANRWSLFLIGLEPDFSSRLCSANSLRTHGMSAGFHAKMSLLSLRKLVSMCSYAWSSSMLIVVVLDGSLMRRSIVFNEVSWELASPRSS